MAGIGRFWLGLAIGLVVGAAAMYLGLRAPWRSEATTVAAVTPDAAPGTGSAGKKKGGKKGGRRIAGGGPGNPGGGDDGGDVVEDTEPIVLTAADRRMEWQGEAVSLPPKTLDMTDDSNARSLDDGEISSAVANGGDAVIDCIVRAATGTDLIATVTLKMLVGGDGKVGRLRVQAPHYLFEQGLHGCVRRAASRFPFPSTGAPTLVTAPFELGR